MDSLFFSSEALCCLASGIFWVASFSGYLHQWMFLPLESGWASSSAYLCGGLSLDLSASDSEGLSVDLTPFNISWIPLVWLSVLFMVGGWFWILLALFGGFSHQVDWSPDLLDGFSLPNLWIFFLALALLVVCCWLLSFFRVLRFCGCWILIDLSASDPQRRLLELSTFDCWNSSLLSDSFWISHCCAPYQKLDIHLLFCFYGLLARVEAGYSSSASSEGV